MTTLPEIEAAPKKLSKDDVRQLSGRLQEYLEQRWNVQIEADIGAGRLDKPIAKTEVDIAANKVKALLEAGVCTVSSICKIDMLPVFSAICGLNNQIRSFSSSTFDPQFILEPRKNQ